MTNITFTDDEAQMILEMLNFKIESRQKSTANILKHQKSCTCARIVGQTDEKQIQARHIARNENVIQIALIAIEKVNRLSKTN